MQANPTRSSGDILQELQSQFPGRYERSHLRTLQRGVRQIRAHLPQTSEEAEAPQEQQEKGHFPEEPELARTVLESLVSRSLTVCEETRQPESLSARSSNPPQETEAVSSRPGRRTSEPILAAPILSKRKTGQVVRHAATVSTRSTPQMSSRNQGQRLTIERAIQQYLKAHRKAGHRPKTLEWHQMALAHLHQYLRTECHLLLVQQITETIIKNWLASLAQTPTPRGAMRSVSTIGTYARSARAFFGWLVERGVLLSSPLSENVFPRTAVPLPQVVSPANFAQMMQVGFSQQAQAPGARCLAARDQALLWVLFDTGITVSELCALRVADLDRHTGLLRVRGKGGKERLMSLGFACQSHLISYLKQMNPTAQSELAWRKAGGDPLFGSRGKQPLTTNGVTMVFARFRKRAGISDATIHPQSLRHSFALRYLQAGGNPQGLQELLGYEGMAQVRQHLRWFDQMFHERMQQEEA